MIRANRFARIALRIARATKLLQNRAGKSAAEIRGAGEGAARGAFLGKE